MKTRQLPLGVVLLALIFGSGWSNNPVRAGENQPVEDFLTYLPLVANDDHPIDAAIVVDHRHTDASKIPAYWLGEAEKIALHYAHTSHGSQVLMGLRWLEEQNAAFNVDIRESGTVALPADSTALRIYDGNNYSGNTYITPEMYWETADGINHTRQVANTGWFRFSLWTWCGQMSYYSDAQITQYIGCNGPIRKRISCHAFHLLHRSHRWIGARERVMAAQRFGAPIRSKQPERCCSISRTSRATTLRDFLLHGQRLLRLVCGLVHGSPFQLRVPGPANGGQRMRPCARLAVHAQRPGFLVADGSPCRLGWNPDAVNISPQRLFFH